jgi:anti-sigma-K factor RskA
MSPADESEWERGSDDAIAAEYVLGALPADERRAVAQRIDTDPDFAGLVDHWEALLAPMAGTYPEIEPPASVKQALDTRLPSQAAPPARRGAGLWQSLTLWRGMAVAGLAGLVLAIALPLDQPDERAPTRLVASLTAEGSDVRYMAVYDSLTQVIGLSHVSGSRPGGRDFELWIITGDGAPESLGIVPERPTAQLKPSPTTREKLGEGAVFAISVEPLGGSPTGQPTGPVMAAGNLRSI